jgi:Ca-activated chloride channel family protein
VFNSPNGWCDYNVPNCRRTVYYGHTDPLISSTALSTLIAEFYAAARENGIDEARLSLQTVRSDAVQESVRDIENSHPPLFLAHDRVQGVHRAGAGLSRLRGAGRERPDLHQSRADADQPPERLVALYPKARHVLA